MLIEYFLNERLSFAVRFYKTASGAFNEIIDGIEQSRPPYDSPPYDESGEPAFIQEWQEAITGLQSIGITSLSMVSSALQLYLAEWVIRIERGRGEYKLQGKGGWFKKYLNLLEEAGVQLRNSPVNLDILEQMILARNRGQHPEDLSSLDLCHSKHDLEKYPSPYFAHESDLTQTNLNGEDSSWWITPRIYIDEVKLSHIATEVTKFGRWMECEFERLEIVRLKEKGWHTPT